MSRASLHSCKDLLEEFDGDFVVKEVAHRIDKYDPWFFPTARFIQDMRMDGYLEAVLVFFDAHSLKTAGHSFGVAVLTPGRDGRAA